MRQLLVEINRRGLRNLCGLLKYLPMTEAIHQVLWRFEEITDRRTDLGYTNQLTFPNTTDLKKKTRRVYHTRRVNWSRDYGKVTQSPWKHQSNFPKMKSITPSRCCNYIERDIVKIKPTELVWLFEIEQNLPHSYELHTHRNLIPFLDRHGHSK